MIRNSTCVWFGWSVCVIRFAYTWDSCFVLVFQLVERRTIKVLHNLFSSAKCEEKTTNKNDWKIDWRYLTEKKKTAINLGWSHAFRIESVSHANEEKKWKLRRNAFGNFPHIVSFQWFNLYAWVKCEQEHVRFFFLRANPLSNNAAPYAQRIPKHDTFLAQYKFAVIKDPTNFLTALSAIIYSIWCGGFMFH